MCWDILQLVLTSSFAGRGALVTAPFLDVPTCGVEPVGLPGGGHLGLLGPTTPWYLPPPYTAGEVDGSSERHTKMFLLIWCLHGL